MMQLGGKVAVVTGGASGIGLGMVKAFLRQGLRVAIADIREDHLERAAAELNALGFADELVTVRMDVTDRRSIETAADAIEARFGRIHILCSNAGVATIGPLKDATATDWDFGITVNLMGPINGLLVFWPRIARHGEGGHIVNTSSNSSIMWMPSMTAIYSTAKAGVVAFSESVRDALLPDGIGVSVLIPSAIRTNIWEAGQNRPERYREGSGFAEAEQELARGPMASELWMNPEEVGDMVVDAIRSERFYIFTHGDWRDWAIARNEEILAEMPDTVTPGLVEASSPWLSEPRLRGTPKSEAWRLWAPTRDADGLD